MNDAAHAHIVIGKDRYLIGRKKGRKRACIFRYDTETQEGVTIATFSSDEEALRFWAILCAVSDDRDTLVRIVRQFVLSAGEWLESQELAALLAEPESQP